MEIYIVEDDMSVISVLQDIIEDNDLGIVCGTSEGQPADVDDILAKNPDMVLIDFLMPEKDGVLRLHLIFRNRRWILDSRLTVAQ